MLRHTLLIAAGVSILGAQALSTTCTAQAAGLAIGDAGACLQLTSLLPVLSASGSIIPSLNTYLTSLCASTTPACSNATLSSAQSSIATGCASDVQAGGTSATEIRTLELLLTDYPEVYAAGCSKNSSTGAFCITETLTTIQTNSNTNISVAFLTSLLTGNGSSLQDTINTGDLCTGCVQGLFAQALRANASVATSSIGTALTSKCGASFISSSPSGVSSAAVASSTSASASASASASSGAASPRSQPLISLPATIAGVSMMVAAVLGGYLML